MGLISPPTYLDAVGFKKHKISRNKRRSCEKLGQRTDEGHGGGNILDEETLPVGDASDGGSDGRHLSASTCCGLSLKTLSDQNLREPPRA